MPFTFRPHELPGLIVVEARTMADERGWFRETYQRSAFVAAGIDADFAQDNLSFSARRGTLRGLHYQLVARGQGKLVRCAAGRIFDVAVDLRLGSPARGQWASIELGEEDGRMVWIPVGFAHGFQALSDGATVAYKATAEYSPQHERGIIWSDSALGITWPVAEAFVSDRDAAWPLLADAETDFRWQPS